MPSIKWTTGNIPDQSGKIAIVTGANSGIGYYTTLHLAAKKAKVIMACRNLDKAGEARDSILEVIPFAELDIIRLDLADLESVRSFAENFKNNYKHLDIQINNSGVMACPRSYTKDGFEMQLGTNHLGHFALTGLLFDLLVSSGKSRVITISSMMHFPGRINFDDLMSKERYNNWSAYMQSKLSNMLFFRELNNRFEAIKAEAISLGAHPGYSATNLQYTGPETNKKNWLIRSFISFANKHIAQNAEMGALPSLRAATDIHVKGGQYYGPDKMGGWRGHPKLAKRSSSAMDDNLSKKFWKVSEELTGIQYNREL